jgi:ornithine--oxo-acid transaminase
MSTDPESRTGFGPYMDRVGPVYASNEDGGDGDDDEDCKLTLSLAAAWAHPHIV